MLQKLKDLIMLGTVSGLLAGLPGRILNEIEFKKGLTDLNYPQMASTLLMEKKDVASGEGVAAGNLLNSMLLCMAGIATAYTLTRTGKDFRQLKGIGIAYLYGILLGGVMPAVGLVKKPEKKRSFTLSLIDHTLLGLLCAELTARLGDENLFKGPDGETENKAGTR